MDNETLRKVQLLQLKIGEEIKRVCDKNNIDYILDSGTLLGAVRHGGFIPWDDDMDIGMTRANYQRFIEAAKRDLGEEYFLQTWSDDKNYPLPFAKVRLNGTKYVENVFEKADMHQGIYVDIFPYDVLPVKRYKQKRLWRRKNFLLALIMMKCHYVKFKSDTAMKYFLKLIMFTFIRFISLFFSKQVLIKKYEKAVSKYDSENSDKLYEQTANIKFRHMVVDKGCLYNTTLLKFEEELFKCPTDYDKYLKDVYGDYMKLPPVEVRNKGHKIIEVDFGKY